MKVKFFLFTFCFMVSSISFADNDYNVHRFDGHYVLQKVVRAKVISSKYIKETDKWKSADVTNEYEGKETISWVCPSELVITSEIKDAPYEGAVERVIYINTSIYSSSWETYDLNLSAKDPLFIKLLTLNSISFGGNIYSSRETTFSRRTRSEGDVVDKRSFQKRKDGIFRYSRSSKSVGFENKFSVLIGSQIPQGKFNITCDYAQNNN